MQDDIMSVNRSSSNNTAAAEEADASYDQWLFTEDELENTPSRSDGISKEKERESRGKGCNFILQVGMLLGLPQVTLATASVYLHRFYMRESLKNFHYYNIAATSLYLATKIEENCRQLKDLIQAATRIAQKNKNLVIDEASKEYWNWNDVILTNEEILMARLCFDFTFEQPYKLLTDFSRMVAQGSHQKDLMRSAWAFVNDSYLTTMCLAFKPAVIAAASLYWAAKYTDRPLPDQAGKPWWEVLDIKLLDIKRACNYMAELYENNPLRNADNKYVTTPENDSVDNRTRVANVSPDVTANTPPAIPPSSATVGSASSTQSHRAPNGRGRDERHVLPTSAPSPLAQQQNSSKGDARDRERTNNVHGGQQQHHHGKSNGSATRRDASQSQASAATMDVDDEKEEGEYDREEGEL